MGNEIDLLITDTEGYGLAFFCIYTFTLVRSFDLEKV